MIKGRYLLLVSIQTSRSVVYCDIWKVDFSQFNQTRMKNANKVAIIIGLIGIAFGIVSAISSSPFEEYGMTIFLGISLAGVGWINSKSSGQ